MVSTELRETSVINSISAIILDSDGRILLQKRDAIRGIYFPGYWGLFGGAIESPENAIKRKLAEELGVVYEHWESFLNFSFMCPEFDHITHNRICYTGVLAETMGRFKLSEGQGCEFFYADQLPKLIELVAFDAAVISMYINLKHAARPISPFLTP